MKHRQLLASCLIGVVLAAFSGLFAITPVADRLENNYVLGLFYSLRGAVRPPSDAIIAAIDSQSLNWLRGLVSSQERAILSDCLAPESAAELDHIRGPGSLPRSVHACLLSKLEQHGFGIVAFDILFARRGEQDDDQRLAAALKKHGKAILLIGYERSVVRDGLSEVMVEREVTPAEMFKSSAATSGAFVVPRTGGPVYAYWARVPGFSSTNSLPEEAVKLTSPAQSDTLSAGSLNSLRYFWLYGPPGTIETISLRDFFSSELRNVSPGPQTTIFVGATDPSATNYPDTFPSHFQSESDAGISGVELAATAYLNLLHNQVLRKPPLHIELMLIVLAAIGSGFVARFSPSKALVILPVVGVSYFVVSAIAFSQGRYFLPIATPIFFTLPLAILTAAFIRYQLAKHLIMRLAPLPIAKRLLSRSTDQRDAATSEEATIVFFDLIGSTAIGEKLDPLDFSAVLNTYHEIIVSEVGKCRGFVSAFSGDGAMAVFTRTDAGSDHASKACHSAIGVITAVRGRNSIYVEKGFPPLALRVGINSGTVAEAEIGSQDRFNFSVVGDVVNLAARLEQLGKKLYPTERDVILVGSATRSQVQDLDLSFTICGLQIIAGREHPEAVYRLKLRIA